MKQASLWKWTEYRRSFYDNSFNHAFTPNSILMFSIINFSIWPELFIIRLPNCSIILDLNCNSRQGSFGRFYLPSTKILLQLGKVHTSVSLAIFALRSRINPTASNSLGSFFTGFIIFIINSCFASVITYETDARITTISFLADPDLKCIYPKLSYHQYQNNRGQWCSWNLSLPASPRKIFIPERLVDSCNCFSNNEKFRSTACLVLRSPKYISKLYLL